MEHIDVTDGSVSIEPVEIGPFAVVEMTSTNEPVTEGQTVTVNYEVENIGDEPGEFGITLWTHNPVQFARDVDHNVQVDPQDTETGTLEWETSEGDAGDWVMALMTPDHTSRFDVEVEEGD